MTDREIDIIDAVGEYVDNKFEGKGRLDGSYIEEAQDYYNELRDRVEDAYEDKTDCNHCYYDSTCIDGENGNLVIMGHYCCDDEYLEPYTLASIDDVAKEMHQDEMATLTLKKALGL
tara:strand:+ start:2354 stop:2704 length:351 start_codon:yes stop_codon:yes gene_type:complete